MATRVKRRKRSRKAIAERQEYGTPRPLFDALNDEFGGFELDVAASDANHLCPVYFTKNCSALEHPWASILRPGARRVAFMNPPFATQGIFVQRAYRACVEELFTVVILLQARMGPRWFSRYASRSSQIRLFVDRVEYVAPAAVAKTNGCDFDSMLLILEPGRLNADPSRLNVSLCDHLGRPLHTYAKVAA